MKKDKLTNCPICKSNKSVNILTLNCGNLDKSTLYQYVRINTCVKCGHIYNYLFSKEKRDLKRYYKEEYAPININATYKTGNMPGGGSHSALKRYDELYNFILPYINKNSRVLDIGCATGGFLNYLYEKKLSNLYGIDLTESFVNHVRKKKKYNIKIGNAESIPFSDNLFDVLVIDQVLEHLVTPQKALREARRVLVDGGILYIGTPNALRYNETNFDFYWFISREHIQHFDINHLKLLAETEGFELLTFSDNESIMLSEELILPNLKAVFRLTDKKNKVQITKDHFNLIKKTQVYIKKNIKKASINKKIIHKLIKAKKPIYIWGIATEFLYLYESIGLKKCNIVGLIDINSYKRKAYMIDGIKIDNKSILRKAKSDSLVLIAATAHKNSIKKNLKRINFKGQILTF